MTPASVVTDSVSAPSRTARVIAITSGKGGVGKSSLALNLAIELGRSGRRVCLLDADTNLANITILAGLTPTYHLQHYLQGVISLQQLLVDGPQGIHIIASASGLADLVNPPPQVLQQYRQLVERVQRDYDYLLIDTAAGLEQTVLTFLAAATELILLITPEPTSLTDAFSLLKVLRPQRDECSVQILVNRVHDYTQARDTFRRFAGAVLKYIGIKPRPLGYIYQDPAVLQSVMSQKPFAEYQVNSPAYRCLAHIAGVLDRRDHEGRNDLQRWQQRWFEGPGAEREAVGGEQSLVSKINELPLPAAAMLVRQVNRTWEQRVSGSCARSVLSDEALRAAGESARKLF